ncbi:hypothetical protein JYT28_01700 [Desulfobulbus sp. AH-315-M07]|nr:hypothetical protein [Desulfobulbus sp. AH-315-M07]
MDPQIDARDRHTHIRAKKGDEFSCIARYLPRQGGAPIELSRGGTVDDEGVLQIGKKTLKQRMKAR